MEKINSDDIAERNLCDGEGWFLRHIDFLEEKMSLIKFHHLALVKQRQDLTKSYEELELTLIQERAEKEQLKTKVLQLQAALSQRTEVEQTQQEESFVSAEQEEESSEAAEHQKNGVAGSSKLSEGPSSPSASDPDTVFFWPDAWPINLHEEYDQDESQSEI